MGGKGGRSKNDTCVALTKFEKNTDVFFSLNLGFTPTLIILLKDGGRRGRSKNDTCVALTKFEKNTDVFFSQNLVSPPK